MNTTERNAYCFYVSLLCKFNNNIIIGATNKKLSGLTGIHQNTINKYLLILKKAHFITENCKNLTINTNKARKKLFKLHLYRSISAKNVKIIIETEILRLHINRQKRAIHIKQLQYKRRTNKESKTLKNNPDYLDGVFNKEVCFSYRYAADKLNTSIFKIQDLLRRANDKGIIKTDKVYSFIKKVRNFTEFKSFQANLNRYSDKYHTLLYDFRTNKVFNLVGTDIKFKIEFP